jgi:hypothetical protein
MSCAKFAQAGIEPHGMESRTPLEFQKSRASIKPRMDADAHGLKQDKKSLQQIRKALLIDELICIAEIFFPIRVYPCPSVVKKVFLLHGYGFIQPAASVLHGERMR